MPLPVLLHDVVEAMDLQDRDSESYLNRDTGEIITVTDEDRQAVEDGKDSERLPEWQRKSLPKVREALESDRFLLLPTTFEIHEWSIMERFANSLSNAAQREELLDSLHDRGAFRMFKSAVSRLSIEDDWYQFRDRTLKEIAKEWLEAHEIPYK